ncbi:MAG: oligosaccharide flippase family protein [Actinobacteria bacterium]|nr:oligosaccharide flippase family protein [Actinomycetota bacterium]
MKTTGARALSNITSLVASTIIAEAIGFVTVAFLARKLTAVGFGRLAFAQAILAYFVLLGDFGLNLFGTREVARDRGNIRKIVNGVVTLQGTLSIIAAALMLLFAILIHRPSEDKSIIMLYAITIILTGISIDWAFRGLERMVIVAYSRIFRALLYAGLVFLLVKDQSDILNVPLNAIISAALSVAVMAVIYIRKYGWIKPYFNLKFSKYALMTGIPFFFSIVLIRIYYNLDTVMLGFMKSDEMVGLYNAAYKIILVILGLGSLLQEAFFPLYSRYYKESREKLQILLNISEKVYATIALPIGVGGTLLAKPLLILIYGNNYEGATIPFQILIWTVVVILFSLTFGFTLMSCDMERAYMLGVGCGALANIILNSLLIPPFGMTGAAVATLAAEVVVIIYMIVKSRRIARIHVEKYIFRPAISSTVMGLAIAWSGLHVLINILIGAVVYSIAFVLLKGITRDDVMLFKRYVLGRSING